MSISKTALAIWALGATALVSPAFAGPLKPHLHANTPSAAAGSEDEDDDSADADKPDDAKPASKAAGAAADKAAAAAKAATSGAPSGAAASAGDHPADAAGAKAIADLLATYVGKAAAPSLSVKPDGAGYLVTVDLGAASAAMKSAGVAYDPAELKFRVVQQADGQWRFEQAALPPIQGHMTPPDGKGRIDMKFDMENMTASTLVDPKLGWIASSKGGADKMRVKQSGPGFDQQFELGKLTFDAKTTSGADGLTMTAREPVETFNFVMDVDPKGVDEASGGPAKPTHVSAKGEGGAADIVLKGFQPGPLTDAWKFVVAHPERADYARDFAALKTVVTALLGDHFTLEEGVKLGKLSVTTEIGQIEIGGASFGLGAANAGPDSGFSERFAATSIKLPDGLVPAMYAPMIPTSFEIGFKASGFDLPAAAQEWFAHAHLDGSGPPLSKEDQEKVTAKLIGSKPIVVDLLPSRIAGPSLNIALSGKITIDNSEPAGAVTIQVSHFDDTAKAIQKLGPEAEQQLVPMIAMVKGLGKPGADGALVWVCELGKDKVMKVNGLPLGKAPF